MPQFVEFVHFRADDVPTHHLVSARNAAIAAVKQAHPALVSVPVLSRAEDGRWTDIWVYQTEAAAEAANSDSGNIPEFLAFAELLTDVSIVSGSAPDGSTSVLPPAPVTGS